MPTFGRYGRFPLKLGGGRRPIEIIHRSLLDFYRRAGLDPDDPVTYSEAYADACVLADIWKASKRAGRQLDPRQMFENLVDWETAAQLYPSANARVVDRRRALHGKLRGFSGNNIADIRDACAAFLGRVFVQVHTTAEADEITYWPGIMPGPPGFEWSSNRETIRIEVRRVGISNQDFDVLMAKLMSMLSDMCPSTMTFGWFVDGGGFLVGTSGLGEVGL